VVSAALAFVGFVLHGKLAPVDQAVTLVVTLVGSLYLALSKSAGTKPPVDP
jgi:hypothetical protein